MVWAVLIHVTCITAIFSVYKAPSRPSDVHMLVAVTSVPMLFQGPIYSEQVLSKAENLLSHALNIRYIQMLGIKVGLFTPYICIYNIMDFAFMICVDNTLLNCLT